VVNQKTGAVEGMVPHTVNVNGQTVITATFTGNNVIGGSLPDGGYTLTVNGADIHNPVGRQGTNYVDRFYRLFGDVGGTDTVNGQDYSLMRQAVQSGNYLPALDFDGNGRTIDQADVNAFFANYSPLAQPASAAANPVPGTSTTLSILGGNQDGGQASLTYSWAMLSGPSGAPRPTFGSNNSNAARNTTVTFARAGTYTFQATVTDQKGLSITSDVTVTVTPTATSIMVLPGNWQVAVNTKQQFNAVAFDQFGNLMTPQPGFTWTVTGVGSISHTGLYTAPGSTAGGKSATVRATAGSVSRSATVTLTTPPVITRAASAGPNPVTGTSTTLTVGAKDASYAAGSLTYTWVQTGGPFGHVTFGKGNGTNSAASLTASFTRAGTYTFLVVVRDPSGASTTSSVTVTVGQTATSIVVTPHSASVPVRGTYQFSAVELDQFGNAMATQPAFTWTVTGVGSISHTGLYTAPGSTAGGKSATVRATAGSLHGSATITVS
jgi:hypothetical protein